MEQATKNTFDKSNYHSYVFKTYKIIKKTIKYSLYIALLYFAYKGFMAWE